MFLGEHALRLDEKGRLFLPAKYRSDFAEGVVITKGQDRCLYIWPAAEFARIAENVRSAIETDPEARHRNRIFFSSGSDEVPDRQGRITVPPGLREYAGLQRDCMVLGAGARMELWDVGSWRGYVAAHDPGYVVASNGVVPGIA